MQHQQPAAQASDKAQQKRPPIRQQETPGNGLAVATETLESMGSSESPTARGQAAVLGDRRLHILQRQRLAGGIGKMQGNGHLQQVMAFVQQNRAVAATELASTHTQPNGVQTGDGSPAVLQRDTGDAQPGTSPNAATGGNAAPAAASLAGEEEQRYNITLQVAPGREESYTGVAQTEALRILREFYNRIHNRVEAGYDSHTYLKSIRDDQWIVGAISDFFADPIHLGIEMPPLWMWNEPRIMLEAALATLNAGLVQPTERNLQRAANAWRKCDRRIYAYREGTISGAERSVTGLRVTAAAGAVAATMATGGLATAAGAGTLGVASATGLGAGVYGFVQEEAGQASEIYNDLRRDFDWGAIVRRGATDAINGFVGALAGGALTRVFQRSFGSFLTNISDDVLLELGLTRDAFLTPAQQFIAEFLGGIGSSPLTTAVTAVVNAAGGGNPPRNAQEFVDLVVQDMVQGGAIQLFLGGLMHFHGRTGGGAPPAGGETPTGPRATIVEEGSGVSRPTAPPAASAGETSAASLPSPTVEAPASQHPATREGTPPASRPASMASGEVETGGTSNGRITTVEGESAPGRPTEVPPEALRVGEGERSPVPPPAEAHYPEGLAEFGLDAAGARRSYRVSLEADLTREAGIWMDPQSGEHVVVQGGRDFVETGWMTSPEMQRSGRMPNWRLVEHYHPEAHGLVERLPSYNDFESIMHWQTVSAETPRPVSSVIRYTDPQTHIEFTTRFGYSPAEARPYWVEYRTPDGRWVSQQFSDPPWNPGSEYSQFMSQSGGMAAPGTAPGADMAAPGSGRASVPESREPGANTAPAELESQGPVTVQEYVNNNRRATADEIRIGNLLDGEAQLGRLPGIARVEGTPEIRGQRSGDYRLVHPDGSRSSADLYQPHSANPESIASNIIEKSGQAQTVIVELGAGNSGSIQADVARNMAQEVVDTPGHSIGRVLVIKNGTIIVDASR